MTQNKALSSNWKITMETNSKHVHWDSWKKIRLIDKQLYTITRKFVNFTKSTTRWINSAIIIFTLKSTLGDNQLQCIILILFEKFPYKFCNYCADVVFSFSRQSHVLVWHQKPDWDTITRNYCFLLWATIKFMQSGVH